MLSKRTLAICAAAILVVAGATGVVLAASYTYDPPNGDNSGTLWKIPENNLTAKENIAQQQIDERINEWAQFTDSQDAAAVAGLFTDNATIALFYRNATTTPQSQVPTGYSPSSTPTGGTAGGGCSVTGQSQILQYLQGAGLTGNNPWPNMAAQRTLTNNTLIKLDFPTAGEAYSHTYVIQGPWKGGNGTAQMFDTWTYSKTGGWQISYLDMLYEQPQPNLPCQN